MRATHEALSYMITPFQNPPITVLAYKGLIDRNGQFKPITTTPTPVQLTPEEFKELISPTSEGKPAGDFRLSDILQVLKKRLGNGAKAPASEPAKEPTNDAAAQLKEGDTTTAPETQEKKSA